MKRRPEQNEQYSVEIDEEGYPVEQELYEDELPSGEKRKKKSFVRKLMVRLIALGLIVLLVELGILLWSGQIWFNEPKKKDYPVRGPIMDSKCGEIFWSKFGDQNIQMCYLRATKGTNHVDESFEKNWKDSKKSKLPVGAMHVFELNSDGKEQADNFLSAVGDMDGRLVPAVEVSPGFFTRLFAPKVSTVGTNLRDLVDRIKEKCGYAPIIKCSSQAYDKYIRGEFSDCPIWYESVFSQPDDDIDWTFWEYTGRATLGSFEKSSRKLYFSVYRYSEEEFEKLIIQKAAQQSSENI